MRYMLVNTSDSNVQVDIHHPTKPYNRKKLHRMGPEVAIALKKGESIDLLPYFNGSLELTHAAVKFSRDIIRTMRPDKLFIYVCDDNNDPLDADKLLVNESSRIPVEDVPDVPKVESIEQLQPSGIYKPLSYMKYKREDLITMNKKDLIKLAARLGLVIGKNLSKDECINIISGV